MKRLSPRQRRYQLLVTRKRTRRHVLAKARAKIRRGGIPKVADRAAKRKLSKGSVVIRIAAPRYFFVGSSADRRRCLQFFDRIRMVVIDRKLKAHVDFSRTRRMMPCGTLLFLAELERMRRFFPGRDMFSCNYPANRVVEQVLQQVGLLDLLAKKARQVASDFDETVRHWRYATGNAVEGAKVEPLVDSLEGRLTPALTQGLFVGLTEAMTNCSHHAYIADRGDGLDKTSQHRWWMFSQEKDGLLSVCFCDLGIGIPKSVAQSGLWDRSIISKIFDLLGFTSETESRLIRAALELNRTRTSQPHRGKGLPQILDVVRTVESGFLRIHSNRGMYSFQNQVESMIDFSGSIRGTLIQWNIPLPADVQMSLPLVDPPHE